MRKFLEYIWSIGFYGWEGNPGKEFSTMDCVRKLYIKYDLKFIFGLNEKGLPPTFIYPRPNIIVKRLDDKGNEIITRQDRDESMSVCFEKESPEDIYNAIFDKNKVFIYDFTK